MHQFLGKIARTVLMNVKLHPLKKWEKVRLFEIGVNLGILHCSFE